MAAPDTHLTAVERLGAAGLLTVTHDALNQERLGQVYALVVPGALTHGLGKEATCATVVREALQGDQARAHLADALNRAAHKERGLLDALNDGVLRERVLTLPQLTLRRERARLMWALAADPRKACGDVLAEMLSELNAAVKAAQSRKVDLDLGPLSDVVETPHPPRDLVRERVERLERERAEFLAQLGMRDAAWRAEVEARAEAERQVALWRTRARDAEEGMQDTQAQLKNVLLAARTPAVAVTRVDRLGERLEAMELDRDTWKERAESLEGQLDSVLQRQAQLAQQLVSRDLASQQRIARLRESLRDVRRQRARPADEQPQDGLGPERLAVHVDVANLAASANHRHAGRVDFVALLRWLGEGRRVARAVAYCVEHGDAERFQGFANALRAAGYEVRVKRPRARSDGTIKADWDMGLAMDVVADTARVDTIIVCSGDGDFVPLLETMRRRWKRVEVCAFPEDTHEDLRRTAQLFHALDVSHTRKSS